MIVALALLATVSQASAFGLGLEGSLSLDGELSMDLCSPLHRDRCVLISVKTGGSACVYTFVGGKILEDGLLPRVLTIVETNALLGYKLEMERYNKKLQALGKSSRLDKPHPPCLCKSCPQQPDGPGSGGSDGDDGSDKEDPHGPNDIPDAKETGKPGSGVTRGPRKHKTRPTRKPAPTITHKYSTSEPGSHATKKPTSDEPKPGAGVSRNPRPARTQKTRKPAATATTKKPASGDPKSDGNSKDGNGSSGTVDVEIGSKKQKSSNTLN